MHSIVEPFVTDLCSAERIRDASAATFGFATARACPIGRTGVDADAACLRASPAAAFVAFGLVFAAAAETWLVLSRREHALEYCEFRCAFAEDARARIATTQHAEYVNHHSFHREKSPMF